MWKSFPLKIYKFSKGESGLFLGHSRKLNVNQSRKQNVQKTRVDPFYSNDRRILDFPTWRIPLRLRLNRVLNEEISPTHPIIDPSIQLISNKLTDTPNNVVDKSIEYFKSNMTDNGKWKLNLSNFEIPFDKVLGVIPVSGQVNLRDGYVKDFRYLRRRGDFNVATDDDKIFTFSGTVEIPNLVAVFPVYDLTFCDSKLSGEIEAIIKTTQVILKVDAIKDDKSEFGFSVSDVQRDVIVKHLKVCATGLPGGLDSLLSIIASKVANRYSKEISELIAKEIDSIAPKKPVPIWNLKPKPKS